MEKLTEEESMNGETEKYMMVNGLMEWKKAKDFGRIRRVIIILESGRTLKLMDMGSMYGQMVTNMKVNGLDLWSMDEGQKHLQMGTNTVAST